MDNTVTYVISREVSTSDRHALHVETCSACRQQMSILNPICPRQNLSVEAKYSNRFSMNSLTVRKSFRRGEVQMLPSQACLFAAGLTLQIAQRCFLPTSCFWLG